jgi:GABA(A) receptor-associated protein
MYRQTRAFEDRENESRAMRRRYPDRIPIIIEPKGSNAPLIDKRKYMTPSTLTFGQLFYVIRKRLHLKSDQALFFFLENNTLLVQTHVISDVYDRHKNEDGFLYVSYSMENTFG